MLRCFATKIIGLVGFEPTACRRGDRSTISSRDHLYLVPFCNIARVALLRSEWQSFPCGLEPTALHVSSPWNHQRCGGECRSEERRVGKGSVVRFSGCPRRNKKTFFSLR